MSTTQSNAARRRFARECLILCAACGGTGRVASESVFARAKRGGNISFLASLGPGRLSMCERGQKGGRPKEPMLQELPQQQ